MKVELIVGEILGNSWELTLANQIRFWNVGLAKSTLQVHHIDVSQDHGPLLTVPMRIENQVYKAIVDSGSEVNIITQELWEKPQVLMDVDASLMLRNANSSRVSIGRHERLNVQTSWSQKVRGWRSEYLPMWWYCMGIEVHKILLCSSGDKVPFEKNSKVWIIALVGEEQNTPVVAFRVLLYMNSARGRSLDQLSYW